MVCCKSLGSESYGWLIGLDDIFGSVVKVHVDKDADASNSAINGALLECWENVGESHRHRRHAEPLKCHGLKLRGKDPDLLAFEVGEVTNRGFRHDAGRLGDVESDTMEALIGTEAKHELQHRGIGCETLSMLHRIHQSRGCHYLEAFIDADKKLRWNIRRLDGAELGALDLPGD